MVTPTLERQKQGGALAEKFEAAYLRSLAFDKVGPRRAGADLRAAWRAVGSRLQAAAGFPVPLRRGRMRTARHGGPPPYDGGRGRILRRGRAPIPLNLEPVLNDPALRKTNFVMVHGGWPFIREIGALLTKPNAYLDFSGAIAAALAVDAGGDPAASGWSLFPEKVMFATDAYPYSASSGWEESAWSRRAPAARRLRCALTGMVRDGDITRARASVLARMVLRENAKKLYRM